MRHALQLTPFVLLVACGPGERPPGTGNLPDARVADAPSPVEVDAAPVQSADAAEPVQCGQVRVAYRDFHASHPDMQSGVGVDPGIVQVDLDTSGKPVFAPTLATSTVHSAATFNQWYRDVPNVNMTSYAVLPLVEDPPGTFTFDNQSYFPLDGVSFGNEGNPHNYHFTSEIHTTFVYHGGEQFQFSGDDDVFVFVNKKLAIDLGGVHDPLTGTIDFDARATELGITVGGTYSLDVFHAERHTVASTFKMTTTIDCLVIL